MAWILRYIRLSRKIYNDLETHGLTSRELDNSEQILCKLVQKESFAEEIKSLENV